jgi:hypothetical protein
VPTECKVCGVMTPSSELTEVTVTREDGHVWTGYVCARCKERLADK